MCPHFGCNLWLKPVIIPIKKISDHRCISCGDTVKVYSKTTAADDRKRVMRTPTAEGISKRQNVVNAQSEAYNKALKKQQDLIAGKTPHTESTITSSKNITSEEKDPFTKFMDQEYDLATSFWGFGVAGTMIVGFICGWLSAAYSKWWLIPYIIFTVIVIDSLWAAATNYKARQVEKKESPVWGFLVQAFCVMGALGLFTMVKDTFF